MVSNILSHYVSLLWYFRVVMSVTANLFKFSLLSCIVLFCFVWLRTASVVPNCLWIVHSCVVLFCFVWLHPVSCIPNVAIVSGLSILVLYCFVLFDFILCLVFPMLSLSLDCPFLCCIVLFCLTSFSVLCPMLPLSLDCPFLVASSVCFNVYLPLILPVPSLVSTNKINVYYTI